MSPRRRLREGIVGAVALALALLAPEADAQTTVEAPSPFLACLITPSKDTLVYPRVEVERKVGGTVRVKLVFASATDAPQATVFFDSVGGKIRDDVLAFVARYRLPCLPPDAAPIEASQEFQFVPDDGRKVVAAPLRDATPKLDPLACLRGAEHIPEYVRSYIERESKGAVLVGLTFRSPDEAPDAKILYSSGGARFSRAIVEYTSRYRLPCLTPTQAPLHSTQWFRFRMEGDSFVQLKDASLPNFLRAMRDPQASRVRFDFQTMGCPFDVRFTLFRPLADNGVGELDRHDPNRREFLEWLRRAELALPEKAFQDVIGETMTISVPCMVVDLL